MQFLIADTFTDSLARLTSDEQKAVKTTAFDLQLNPASPGMQFHKLEKAKDKNFWSVRVNSDIRLIVHKTEQSLLLCYVDHHDRAYDWGERRRLETHPSTAAAQIVEIRETVKEIIVPVYIQRESSQSRQTTVAGQPLFAGVPDDELLGYGVPREWLSDVRHADEDTLLSLADHLPAEAAEALLQLATGGRPAPRYELVSHAAESPAAYGTIEPFNHPDAQRRFRVISSVDELQHALDFPWEKWTVFLHPEQRRLVEDDYSGPVRVSGSAGTGKTIVALHRAAHLARRYPDARILLTTFSDALAGALHTRLRRLLGNEPRLAERIDVCSLDEIGQRLYKIHVGTSSIVDREVLRGMLKTAAGAVPDHNFSLRFLIAEWDHVVDPWQVKNWESYRDVARLGRKTRLPETKRKLLWSIFEHVLFELKSRQMVTCSEMFSTLSISLSTIDKILFDFVIVDEAQDIGVAHLRFFASLAAGRPNALFFAGDLGQRIFQQPYSWKALGVDIRGRSYTLRVNYRTTHQIRSNADRLLSPVMTDVDGNSVDRGNTVSVFNGSLPDIITLENEYEETKTIANWIKKLSEEGLLPHEFGVFVRSSAQLKRAETAVREAGLVYKILDDHVDTISSHVSIGTMHLAKGLEFRAVVVMACDDEVLPLQERIEAVGDDADLQEIYDTERHLLYVACTRARDYLLVTGVHPASEFLDDMNVQ